MGFTGMFSVETVLKIIGFGIKVGILELKNKTKQKQKENLQSPRHYQCGNSARKKQEQMISAKAIGSFEDTAPIAHDNRSESKHFLYIRVYV